MKSLDERKADRAKRAEENANSENVYGKQAETGSNIAGREIDNAENGVGADETDETDDANEDGANPYGKMGHNEVDAVLAERGGEKPDGWDKMKIADKRVALAELVALDQVPANNSGENNNGGNNGQGWGGNSGSQQ